MEENEWKPLVKVFTGDKEGNWDAGYQGYLQIAQKDDGYYLIVEKEDHLDEMLLDSRIRSDEYIQESESENASKAVSFEDQDTCSQVLRIINEVSQSSMSKKEMKKRRKYLDENEGSMDFFRTHDGTEISLQLPESIPMNYLETLEKIMKEGMGLYKVKQIVADQMLEHRYIEQLLAFHQNFEDLENMEELHRMFTIFRGIVMTADIRVYKEMLHERNIERLVGVFEYDPEYPGGQAQYREYIRNQTVHKLVEFKDEELLELIRETFRLNYLKDVVLARILDDESFSLLYFLIRSNQSEIVNKMMEQKGLVDALMEKLPTDTFDVLRFVKELCGVSKTTENNETVMEQISQHTGVIVSLLENAKIQVRMMAVEVLFLLMEINGERMRTLFMTSKEDILKKVIQQLLKEEDGGMIFQLVEFLKLLACNQPSDEFLNFLYEEKHGYVRSLLVDPHRKGKLHEELVPHLIELACMFIRNHKFRIKYVVLNSTLSSDIADLCQHPRKHVVCSAIQYLKTCIQLNDNFYNRYLMKHDLIAPLLRVLEKNQFRDNLITSSVLCIFDFILQKNIISIISHLVEQHSSLLDSAAIKEPLFAKLVESYNHSLPDYPKITPSASENWTATNREEEEYFEKDDGKPSMMDTSSHSSPPALESTSLSLVDYPDDSEDKDSTFPPPIKRSALDNEDEDGDELHLKDDTFVKKILSPPQSTYKIKFSNLTKKLKTGTE